MKVFVLIHSVHERYEYGSDAVRGVFSERDLAVAAIFSEIGDAKFESYQGDERWIDHHLSDQFTDAWWWIDERELNEFEKGSR